ncbi:dihydrofolate reductase [Rhodopirellula maiorica SM1]|uniref:dihydrofolate reductase n=2 Tax=Novipirellula TaxID=2795426 RepID=M5RM94_9BACT|nr:dihydrofolate reductase [Rhodopirellula maiorica SM1]
MRSDDSVTDDRKTDRSRVIALVAMTPTGVIGKDGDMPWRLRSDLMRFKQLTMGGTLIMGRRTYDSIGRPLPGRRTIVVTRNADWRCEGVCRAENPEQAIETARHAPASQSPPTSQQETSAASDTSSPNRGIYVVGGAEIYRQLLPCCDEVWLTQVWSSVCGDTTLSIELSKFRQIEQTRIIASSKDSVPTEFIRMVHENS